MKDRFQQLFQAFLASSPATRIALVVGTLAVLAIGGVTTWFANRPDFVELWRGLTPVEASEYKKALAEGNINFRSTPSPDNAILVDVSDIFAAEAQVARAGLAPVSKGIVVADGGAASAFLSAGARKQMMDKREWQECEAQLERLRDVLEATVTSSGSDTSAYGPAQSPTISVILSLRPGVMIDPSVAHTMASMVRGHFGVPMENITIADQQGILLHDGLLTQGGMSANDLFAHQQRSDSLAERKANTALARALGEGMAYATVSSSWNYIQKEIVKESAGEGEAKPYYESETKSNSKNSGAATGGPAGTTSNITQEYGVESAGVPTSNSGGSQDSTRTEKRSIVGRETSHETLNTPELVQLSVSLVLDESKADQLPQLTKMVKAAVGFSETRNDIFEFYSSQLPSVIRGEDGAIIPAVKPEPKAAPNAYMEMGLKYGVEIIAALGFLLVLMKSLKSSGKASAAGTLSQLGGDGSPSAPGRPANATIVPGSVTDSNPAGITEEEIAALDPSALARAQVEDLVRNHPEKVSEILSFWASNSRSVGASR
jgi:flagellar biosynthesis/type III secretory pathway M-ring protein FliF/YscJ